MATLREVAEKAKVSVSTVSKYINDSIEIKEETKNRIDEAILETGYKRSFKPKKPSMDRTIAMVLPELTSLKFAQLVNSVIDEAARKDYTILVFTNKNSSQSEEKIVDQIIQMGASATILVKEPKGESGNKLIERLEEAEIPTVSINRLFTNSKYDTVNTDFYNAMKDSMYHFYSLGITNIGLVLGWKEQAGNEVLLEAIRDVKEELDIKDNIEENIFYSDFNPLKYTLAYEFFRRRNVKAAFLISDVIAAPLVQSLQERDLNPQKDFKMVSLSDNNVFEVLKIPGLDIDTHLLAKETVDTLMNRLDGIPYQKHKIIRGHLHVR